MAIEQYLKTLVGFYPVSSNQAAVRQLLGYIKVQCEKSGLYAELLQYGEVHNLYVSRNAEKHVKVLLQAHVDVVPGDNQPCKATEDSIEGRGTFDMLFAAAAYLKLIDDLAGQIQSLDMGIFFSGDEELAGEYGVKSFLADGYSADVCILPDAGDAYGKLSVGAKGAVIGTFRVNGRAHHGSRPWEGDGAAIKLAHFLVDAEKLFDHSNRDTATMTVTTLSGGDADNRGPAYAIAGFDIRYKDVAERDSILKQLKDLLTQYDGELKINLEGDSYSLDQHHPMVKPFIDMYTQQLGRDIEMVISYGSSDARFFTKYNIPVIMLRPDGAGAHGDNEWVSRESLHMFYNLLKQYVTTVALVDQTAPSEHQ